IANAECCRIKEYSCLHLSEFICPRSFYRTASSGRDGAVKTLVLGCGIGVHAGKGAEAIGGSRCKIRPGWRDQTAGGKDPVWRKGHTTKVQHQGPIGRAA